MASCLDLASAWTSTFVRVWAIWRGVLWVRVTLSTKMDAIFCFCFVLFTLTHLLSFTSCPRPSPSPCSLHAGIFEAQSGACVWVLERRPCQAVHEALFFFFFFFPAPSLRARDVGMSAVRIFFVCASLHPGHTHHLVLESASGITFG